MSHRALLIANAAFSSSGKLLPRLDCAFRDIDEVERALVDPSIGLFVEASTFRHRDESTERLLKALEEFCCGENVTKNDDLLIYFSTHGYLSRVTPRLLLCTDSTRVKSGPNGSEVSEETAIDSKRIVDLIMRSKASSVLVLLDCCFAGAFPTHELFSDRNSVKNREIIMASQGLSPTGSTSQMSPFTDLVIRCLRSNRTAMTTSDHLFEYVFKRLRFNANVWPMRSRLNSDKTINVGRNAVQRTTRRLVLLPNEVVFPIAPVADEPLRCTVDVSAPEHAGWEATTAESWIALTPMAVDGCVGITVSCPPQIPAFGEILVTYKGQTLTIDVSVGAPPSRTLKRSVRRLSRWVTSAVAMVGFAGVLKGSLALAAGAILAVTVGSTAAKPPSTSGAQIDARTFPPGAAAVAKQLFEDAGDSSGDSASAPDAGAPAPDASPRDMGGDDGGSPSRGAPAQERRSAPVVEAGSSTRDVPSKAPSGTSSIEDGGASTPDAPSGGSGGTTRPKYTRPAPGSPVAVVVADPTHPASKRARQGGSDAWALSDSPAPRGRPTYDPNDTWNPRDKQK